METNVLAYSGTVFSMCCSRILNPSYFEKVFHHESAGSSSLKAVKQLQSHELCSNVHVFITLIYRFSQYS